ncbi:two-component system response regulator UczR [Spirosoma luteolum]
MKILLIENDADYQASVKRLLDRHPYRLELVDTGWLGISAALHGRYDMLVVDAELPDLDGFDLVRRLRKEGDITPVLMVSRLASAADKARGLYAGADDYLVRPADPDELLARLYALHRRRTGGLHAPTVISAANLHLNVAEKVAYRASKRIRLTAREFQLLSYLIENAGRVVTKTQILEKVWDSPTNVKTNKVEVYINFLRKKIDHGFEHKLIQTAMGVGYLLRANL